MKAAAKIANRCRRAGSHLAGTATWLTHENRPKSLYLCAHVIMNMK